MSESVSMDIFKAANINPASVIRKAMQFQAGAIDRKKRLIKGKVATRSPDLEGDLFIPRGLDATLYNTIFHKRVCWGHDTNDIIGVNRNLKVHDDYVFALNYIFPTTSGDDALTLVEYGGANGYSIQFGSTKTTGPTVEEQQEFDGGVTGLVFRETFLLEISLVGSPANADCVVELVEKGLIKRATAHKMGLIESPVRKLYPAAGPAIVEKSAEVDPNALKIVYRDDKGNWYFKLA